MSDARSRLLPAPLLTSLRTTLCAAGLVLGGAMSVAQAEPGPPPGLVTGAYGQSLVQQQAPAPAVQAPPVVAPTQASFLPTAATDPVSRFLQERGVLAQASQQGMGSKLLNQARDTASDMVLAAMNFLGVRYKLGGNTMESGFDCSGFTRHIFEMSLGLVLPRRADEQAKSNRLLSIKKDELKPGDLVFFNTMRATFSHVGIYVGEGKFVHAPRTGAAVRVDDMREAYWSKRFTGARRADTAAAPGGQAATAAVGGSALSR